MNVVITGATGLVGRALLAAVGRAHVLSRNPARARTELGPDVTAFRWRTEEPPPADAFTSCEAVFHLAGEPIGVGRWTPARKQRIRDSREAGTRHLVDALIALPRPPRVLVVASAVGIYGDRGDEVLSETSHSGDDFLAQVCVAWEREARRAERVGIRVVNVRLGIVLSRDGGALERMLLPFRLGVGGPLGRGRQWMPWVHIDDAVGLLRHAAAIPTLHGPMNAVAPTPVTNGEFSRTLGRVLSRPSWLPAPRLAVRIALGEVADAVFASQRVVPTTADASGYPFRYGQLDTALRACV